MLAIDEIRDRVIDILARISGIPSDDIKAESTFEDVDLDSLAKIELLVDLEREFDIEIPEDEDDEELLKQIQSVEDAARMVENNLTQQNAV